MIKRFTAYRYELSLIIVVLIAHWQLLVIDSITWDSLLFLNFKLFGDYQTFQSAIFDTGRRMGYYVTLLLCYLPHTFIWYKLITLASYIVSALLLYRISLKISSQHPSINFLFSCFVFTIPIYTLSFEPICITYTLTTLLFYLGCYFYLLLQKQKFVIAKIAYLTLTLLFLFWSYEVQSYFLYTYIFLFAFFLKAYFETGDFIKTALQFLYKNIILVIFPVLAFVTWKILFPISGPAKDWGYNQINLNVVDFIKHFSFSIYKLCIKLPQITIQLWFSNPISALFFTCFSATCCFILFKSVLFKNDSRLMLNKKRKTIVLLFMLLALIAAIAPYALVGKDYGAFNRNNRNGLLLSIPMSLLILFSVSALVKNMKLNLSIGLLLLTLFITSTNISYLFWESNALRFRKVEQLLRGSIPAFNSNYIIVTEKDYNPMNQFFVFYEYNFLFKYIINKETFLVLDEHSKKHESVKAFLEQTKNSKAIFMFKDFDNIISKPVNITLNSSYTPHLCFEKIVLQYYLSGKSINNYPIEIKVE